MRLRFWQIQPQRRNRFTKAIDGAGNASLYLLEWTIKDQIKTII